MATIRFTDADRDDQGFVKVPEPRSLADLLPSASAPATPARRPMTRAEQIALIAVALVAAGGLIWSWRAAPAAAPPRPAATVQTSGESAPKPSPPPATAPATAGRLLIAFAAPDGQPLGAIESTRPLTPTAHYGEGWIQADVRGSGLVWLRRSDSPDLAIVGPDLAPKPTATPAPVPPTATPEPRPPCLTAGPSGQVVTVCGWGDLDAAAQAKWLATYGGNVGTVITPSPYGGTK
jgi:hypothetical protein